MSYKLRFPARRIGPANALLPPLFMLLSACGGDGITNVASLPPPPVTPAPTPTPTPTTLPPANAYPITRVGSYDLIGRVALGPPHVTGSGEFTMAVSRPSVDQGFVYTMTGPAGFLPISATSIEYGPAGSWSADPLGFMQDGYSRTLPFSADENLITSVNFDVGYSYVSMGAWEWAEVLLNGGSAGGYNELLFVAGDRTPQAGIPASGTATYDARTLLGRVGVPFALTADFGQRTISTRIDQDYRYNPNGDIMDYPTPGIHVGGSSPFSNNGSFDIPLEGTANWNSSYAINTPDTPPSQPARGDMNGAFFGPHAEQVGGTFSINNAAGVQLFQDAFVGQQHHP